MRHMVMIGAALVALGCSDPEGACRAAAYDLHVWSCETCPGTSVCPSGDPGTLDEFDGFGCEGADTDWYARRFECSLQCFQELVDRGINVCPPRPNPPTWQLEREACIEACAGTP